MVADASANSPGRGPLTLGFFAQQVVDVLRCTRADFCRCWFGTVPWTGHLRRSWWFAKGCRRLRSWWLGNVGSVPHLLGSDASWQSLVRALGVVDLIEPVDLVLELPVALRHGLLVQPPKQRLVKRSFLPRGVGLFGLPVIASTPEDEM